jgi:translation initiation factor 1
MRLFAGTPWDQPPVCERCGRAEAECACPPPPPTYLPPTQQQARVLTEKRARGKLVTVVRGLKGEESDLPALLSSLKTTCGAGGTLKEEQLELQGDHTERVRALLVSLGYKVR